MKHFYIEKFLSEKSVNLSKLMLKKKYYMDYKSWPEHYKGNKD